MLVVMNSHATEKDIKRVEMFIESKGFEARVSHGEARTVVHAIGVKEVDQRDFELLHGVDDVIKLSTNKVYIVGDSSRTKAVAGEGGPGHGPLAREGAAGAAGHVFGG